MVNILIPRHNNEVFNTFLEPSLKKFGMGKVFQMGTEPGAISKNIFSKYNDGIEAMLQTGLGDDDIVCFVHEDVGIVDNNFQQKLEMVFSEKKDVGLIGIAGTMEFTDNGGWWMNHPSKLRGHLIQGKENAPINEGFHLVKGPVGYYDDCVAVDGCFMVTKGKIIKEGLRFDNVTFNEGNDFYDIDLGFQVLEMGYKVAVVDILMYHKSSGMGSMAEPWKLNKEKLIKKWTDKGHKFPIVKSDFKVKEIINNIVEIDI